MMQTVTGEITAVKVCADRNRISFKITIDSVDYNVSNFGITKILKSLSNSYPTNDVVTKLVGATVTLTLDIDAAVISSTPASAT